jgi:predicted dehydrogenase
MAGGKYNVGIIGYGLSAKTFHIPFVNAVDDFNLYAIVQRSRKSDDDASKDWPHVKLYHSAEDLVQDEHVHVVIVTTAPELHLSLAKLALSAKKHGMLRLERLPLYSVMARLMIYISRG